MSTYRDAIEYLTARAALSNKHESDLSQVNHASITLHETFTEFEDMRLESGQILEKTNALEAKLAEREWQPIETAPKDGTEILIACQREHKTYMYVAWHESLDDWWQVTRGNSTVIRNASHWMPLPTPPTQEIPK